MVTRTSASLDRHWSKTRGPSFYRSTWPSGIFRYRWKPYFGWVHVGAGADVRRGTGAEPRGITSRAGRTHPRPRPRRPPVGRRGRAHATDRRRPERALSLRSSHHLRHAGDRRASAHRARSPGNGSNDMASKRVDPAPSGGRGRKPGVVKSSKESTSNRAFYLLTALVAVAGIGWLTYQSTRSSAAVQVSPIDTTLPKVQLEGYVLWSDSSKNEVTDCDDFECPACGRLSVLTEPDVRKNFVATGKVRWRFIDTPLNIHKNTWQASRAAACADEQGKFWEFHDQLYQTQDQWNGEATSNPDKFMKGLARQLGLNTSQFDQCVDSKKYQAKIQAHYAIGEKRQINSTPTFMIGDKQVVNALTYDQIAGLIN